MNKSTKGRKIMSAVLAFLTAFTMMFGTSSLSFAKAGDPVEQTYGDFACSKISNPASGAKMKDGINTNDITGYPANRLNSYAWAMAARGDSIYIGTNRTLFGSSLNACAEMIRKNNPDITDKKLGDMVTAISGGDVPVNLEDEDYIPQIIRFDVKKGSTEVIYRPGTAAGEDGRLYYTDRDGAIIPNADVSSETASFRSVVQFNGNLYFGTLGANMLQLVRVDGNDNTDIVFQTNGSYSSLRAGCTYDDGTGETIYFGGQDVTNTAWRQYRQMNPDKQMPLPIVIRYLDPKTAGTDQENWNGLVADFSDFGEYAYASVYSSGGGNVWDLCPYNGKLYLILAYDGGWAMFRGENGGEAPNKYGWTWTEIVGNNGKYPLAMDSAISGLNEQYRADYGCSSYGAALNGSGLLESAATPYVYNGKMYIGSFDNATMLQAQTVFKLLAKLQALKNVKKTGDMGPSLTQIFAPFYEALSHPQHIWVMDEKETIAPVESANALLDGTTNDYVWRFIEYGGRLYTGTFDSATAYNYYLDDPMERLQPLLEQYRSELPEYLQQLLAGTFSKKLQEALNSGCGIQSLEAEEEGEAGSLDESCQEYENAAINASVDAEAFLNGDATAEELLDAITELKAADEELQEMTGSNGSGMSIKGIKANPFDQISKEAQQMVDWLLQLLDVKGLQYWVDARKLIKQDENGFDLFVTEDGENWERILGDGLKDPYNYGARTFTICNNDLYLGTANPYYGAQIWKVTCSRTSSEPAVITPVAPQKGTAVIKIKKSSRTYKAKALKKKKKSFKIGASVNSKGSLSYEVLKYKNKASRKYLKFNTRTGKITVRKGTPKGKYAINVRINAKETSNYKSATITKKIKVTVK